MSRKVFRFAGLKASMDRRRLSFAKSEAGRFAANCRIFRFASEVFCCKPRVCTAEHEATGATKRSDHTTEVLVAGVVNSKWQVAGDMPKLEYFVPAVSFGDVAVIISVH
jgi:hypothetical protein